MREQTGEHESKGMRKDKGKIKGYQERERKEIRNQEGIAVVPNFSVLLGLLVENAYLWVPPPGIPIQEVYGGGEAKNLHFQQAPKKSVHMVREPHLEKH